MVVSQGAALVPSQGGTNPASFGKAEPLHLIGRRIEYARASSRQARQVHKCLLSSRLVPTVPRPRCGVRIIVSGAHSAPQDSQAATRMSIYNPALSPIEEPSAQEWGKEADEAFSLVAQLLGDILAWFGSVWPLSPRAAEQAVLAARGQALREGRSRRPGDVTLPAGGFACQHGGGTSMPGAWA